MKKFNTKLIAIVLIVILIIFIVSLFLFRDNENVLQILITIVNNSFTVITSILGGAGGFAIYINNKKNKKIVYNFFIL